MNKPFYQRLDKAGKTFKLISDLTNELMKKKKIDKES